MVFISAYFISMWIILGLLCTCYKCPSVAKAVMVNTYKVFIALGVAAFIPVLNIIVAFLFIVSYLYEAPSEKIHK